MGHFAFLGLLLQVGEQRVHGLVDPFVNAIVSACFDLSLLPLAPLVRFVVAGEALPEVVAESSAVAFVLKLGLILEFGKHGFFGLALLVHVVLLFDLIRSSELSL